MDALGIPLKRKVKSLSGGQRAQVSLTMALAKRAPLLVLDEPVSSLDPVARLEFMREVMASAADTGLTVVIASHVVSELERLCDWLIVLTGGRVQLAGPADDLLAATGCSPSPARPRTPSFPGSPSTAPTATGTPPCWSAPTRHCWRRSSAPDGRPTRWASNSSSWPTCSAARRRRPQTIPPGRGAARAGTKEVTR
jgi:energy-coupling factor transporter ATP-binding protein EcfA2